MRASNAYRMQAAQNLLRRFWFETRSVDPLPAEALNAFAAGAAFPTPAATAPATATEA